jgi:hypothetical protein
MRHRAGPVVVVALVALLLGSCSVSLSTFCQPDPGEIVFGLDLASNTSVGGCLDTFKREGDFAFVGIFPRHVTGLVALDVIKNGEPPRRAGGLSFDEPGNYYSGRWHLSDFPGPGHYVLEMKLDSEVLAVGEFDLTE